MTNDDKLIGELAVFLYSLSPQRDDESELDRDLSFGEIDDCDQETLFSEATLVLEHLKGLNAFKTTPPVTPEVRERCAMRIAWETSTRPVRSAPEEQWKALKTLNRLHYLRIADAVLREVCGE